MSTSESTTNASLAPLDLSDDRLPPFRSAREFPIKPKEEDLAELYSECLLALKQTNEARALLKSRMALRKESIVQIRTLLVRLEHDVTLAGMAKVRVQSLNELLVGELAKYEQLADDFVSVASEAQRAPRTRLKHWIDRLKILSRRWQALRVEQREKVARAMESLEDV